MELITALGLPSCMALLLSALMMVNFPRIHTQNITACNHPIFCYGSVLNEVQLSHIFSDSKDFVDRPLSTTPDQVEEELSNAFSTGGVPALKHAILNLTFDPGSDLLMWEPSDWTPKPSFLEAVEDVDFRQWGYDLNGIWKQLGRQVSPSVVANPEQHSLLPLPHPFIVPGGRFREAYYWDSFWVVQGLLLGGMEETASLLMENMVFSILRYGIVPNGGRIYYTGRSQPPLLTQMVELYYNWTSNLTFVENVLPALSKEYEFWMVNRSVKLPEGTVNRYSVPTTTPRPESYAEDVQTASQLPPDMRNNFYSEVASAAESGWDFSSRWLEPGSSSLSFIRTHKIVPVDLNAILCENEASLQRLYTATGQDELAEEFGLALQERRRSFDQIFWNEEMGMWLDRDLDTQSHLDGFYASSLVPLLWGCNPVNSTKHQATLKALETKKLLDYPGGIPTSLVHESGQQWDFPNAWAPLQWFPVAGWAHSEILSLRQAARKIAQRWLFSTYSAWKQYNHTMFEKYLCNEMGSPGQGGEYVVQSGFGWTNGVVLYFLWLYPNISLEEVDTNISGNGTMGPVGQQESLGWIAAPVLLCLAVVLIGLCAVWCRWLYQTGERRYWGRVHNEHLVAAGSGGGGTSSHQERDESSEERDENDSDKKGLFSWDV